MKIDFRPTYSGMCSKQIAIIEVHNIKKCTRIGYISLCVIFCLVAA